MVVYTGIKITHMRSISILLSASLFLSACMVNMKDLQSVSTEDITNLSPAPAVESTPSPTIIWFPATSTFTPFPTSEATATILPFPGMGKQIFLDDFSRAEDWSSAGTESTGSNNLIINRNRLTLAINQSPARLMSINTRAEASFTDFYAEMTVSASRCTGDDTYGILFRSAAENNTYRFMVNCKGMVSADHFASGSISLLQKWVPSGDAPPAAPGFVKMAVWAAGAEMRFYLNDHFQFSVTNNYLRRGSVGVFANSLSPDGMNISFSDLSVNSVDYVSPTPTITPTKTHYPTSTHRPTP